MKILISTADQIAGTTNETLVSVEFESVDGELAPAPINGVPLGIAKKYAHDLAEAKGRSDAAQQEAAQATEGLAVITRETATILAQVARDHAEQAAKPKPPTKRGKQPAKT